jgi:hypothetical protein
MKGGGGDEEASGGRNDIALYCLIFRRGIRDMTGQ